MTWSGSRSDFLLFADSDGDKFAALLAVGGWGISWCLEGFGFILLRLPVFAFYDDASQSNLPTCHHSPEVDFSAFYDVLNNYFSAFSVVTVNTFYCHYMWQKWYISSCFC